MRRPPSVTDPLASSPLFASCSRRELSRLARHVDQVTVKAGTPIATEGTRPHAVYLVSKGHVTMSADGQLVGEVGPGKHFGEISVLSGDPIAYTAVAGTDVELIEIGEREFVAAIDTMPAVTHRILRDLASGAHLELAA